MSANGSVVVVNAKDAIMREKKKSFSLSKTKVAYIESVTTIPEASLCSLCAMSIRHLHSPRLV